MDFSMILTVFGGFLTAVGAALLFRAPTRAAFICGGIGALAGMAKIGMGAVQTSSVISTFVATLLVALLSHIAARVEKKPVTVYLIPCIFLFVPGAGMYQIVFSLIENRSADAISSFFRTMEEAGAIALSIFVIDTLFRLRKVVHAKCT